MIISFAKRGRKSSQIKKNRNPNHTFREKVSACDIIIIIRTSRENLTPNFFIFLLLSGTRGQLGVEGSFFLYFYALFRPQVFGIILWIGLIRIK